MKHHGEHESHAMEWLAGTLIWEANLGVLRAQDQSSVARATGPELRAIAGQPQYADRHRAESRIDRVA